MKRDELRFIVLHHTGVDEPHFDLMVESAPGSLLATWRCTHWPPQVGETFTLLGDHRREYLDYQGPVSNDRGEVRRVISGLIISLEKQADYWQVEFPGHLKLNLPR